MTNGSALQVGKSVWICVLDDYFNDNVIADLNYDVDIVNCFALFV